MAVVRLRDPLKRLAGGRSQHPLEGATVGDLLRALEGAHPAIGGRILDERGSVRRHSARARRAHAPARRAALRPHDREHQLQAAIAAAHARAPSSEETDWSQIAALYEQLLRATPTPVVALNHAAAVAMADGPEAGLALVERIEGLER